MKDPSEVKSDGRTPNGYDSPLPSKQVSKGEIKKRKSLRRLNAQELFRKSEFWEQLIKELSLGANIAAVAEGRNIPYTMLRDEIKRRPDISQRISEAKEDLGEACGNKVVELAGRLEEENPYVAMKGYMWAASRLSPDTYGDKKQVKIEKNVSQQHIIELRQMQQQRDLKVIEDDGE